MNTARLVPVLSWLLVQMIACGPDVTGPDRGDPAQYALTSPVEYACGAWAPAQPTVQLGLFDVVFDRNGTADPDAAPSRSELALAVEAGGTIIHTFRLNLLRVILPPSAAATLPANAVIGVEDAGNYDVGVTIGFRNAPDTQIVTRAGGRVIAILIPANVVEAVVPDARIAVIRSDAAVSFVDGPRVACPA